MDLALIANQVKQLKQQQVTALQLENQLKQELQAAIAQYDACEHVQQLVQRIAQEVQNQVHKRISDVVSRCLRVVFADEAYELKIDFEMKRGRTEAKLTFVRDNIEVSPLTASGGGVVDVASFALRLAALILTKPEKRRLLVLDEPFRFVSADYRNKVCTLLQTLSEELNLQLIMVTHDPALQVGNVVELG